MTLAFPKPVKRRGRGCRVSDRDDDLKRQRGYRDKKSFVRRDGTEVLHGSDWKKRKEELWERCGGQCEYVAGGIRCRESYTDPHHLEKRSVRRDDRMRNLQGLCRPHHELLDPRKPRWSKEEAR